MHLVTVPTAPAPGRRPVRLRQLVVLALVAPLVALVGLALSPSAAHACSCVQEGVAQQVEASDVVVLGTLTDLRDGQGRPVTRTVATGQLRYVVQVQEAFKGRTGDNLEFVSAASGSACGLGARAVGREYLFFLSGSGADLRGNACRGMSPADSADVAQIEQLVERQRVAAEEARLQPVASPDRGSAPSVATAVLPGVVLAVLAGLGLAVVRRVLRH